MVEMAKHDVVIVTGGDSSMNEFFVQPEDQSIADLKGRTVIVDCARTPPTRCRRRRSCA
jgi:hypothetical protein